MVVIFLCGMLASLSVLLSHTTSSLRLVVQKNGDVSAGCVWIPVRGLCAGHCTRALCLLQCSASA